MFDILAGLNAEQRAAAAFAGDGPLRILAGAGTGKTTALASRVSWLVGTGTPPERILLLTFTRRAARQMLARSETLLAAAGDRHGRRGRVQGGTFHSVAHSMLRRHAAALGLPEGFSVLDTGDAADVIDLVRDDHLASDATRRRFPRKAVLLDLYSRAVNTGTSLTAVIAETAPWCAELQPQIAAICRDYVARKKALGLLDFDDLLLYWRTAAADASVGRQLAEQFDHVLVDEYQDVNALQVDVLVALRARDRRLTVVGDDAQAVYGFRAANPRHLLDFALVFPDATTITLQTNYRSSPQILSSANAVGAAAPEGFQAVLRAADPARSDGARPRLVRCRDEDGQSAAVAEQVLEHREAGIALREQAVLFRAAHHADALEVELSLRGIPYVKYGGLRYLEAAHVKDLLALFRLADNPRDELAWFRLLQLLDGVGPATARKVIAALDLAGETAVHDRWADAALVLPERVRPAADATVAALASRAGEAVGAHAARLALALEPLLEQSYANPEARKTDLDALVHAAGSCARLTDVAAEVTLEPPRSTGELAGPPVVDEDWLTLSTIHSAKGLEWDVVHVIHAADGNIPSDMSLGTKEGLEEERRLFYVALTRPRRALHVYFPLRYHHHRNAHDDKHSWAQPSRFLDAGVLDVMEQVAPADPPTPPSISISGLTADTVTSQLEALWR